MLSMLRTDYLIIFMFCRSIKQAFIHSIDK